MNRDETVPDLALMAVRSWTDDRTVVELASTVPANRASPSWSDDRTVTEIAPTVPADRPPPPWSDDAPTLVEGLPAWSDDDRTPAEAAQAWSDDDHTRGDGWSRLQEALAPDKDVRAWSRDDQTPADGWQARFDDALTPVDDALTPVDDVRAWTGSDCTPAEEMHAGGFICADRSRPTTGPDRAPSDRSRTEKVRKADRRIQAATRDQYSRLKDAWTNRTLRLVSMFSLGLLVVLVAWAARPAPPALPHDEGRVEVGPSAPALFEAALGSIRDGEWDAAIPLLKEAAALDPSREEIARYLELTRAESAAASLLVRARGCLDDGDLPCVEGALAGIRPGTLVAARHAGDLRSRLEEIRLAPDAEGGAAGAEVPSSAPGLRAASTTQPGSVGAPFGGMGRASGPSGPAGAPSGGRTARQVELAGRGARAHEAAGRSGTEASTAHDGTTDDAKALSAARLVQAGVRARLADDLELAAERFGQALALDPANREARAEMEAVRSHLSEIFRRAYARIDGEPERAARGLRLVSRLAPTGDPLRAKAEKWLARISSR